jgi:hypothetical protein
MSTKAEAIRTAHRVMGLSPITSFGGWQYDATSDGVTVHIREMTPRSSSYVIRAKMPASEFYAHLLERGYNDCTGDPAVFSRLCASCECRY